MKNRKLPVETTAIEKSPANGRRYFEIARSMIVEQGGAQQCSAARVQLTKRFAAAAALAEQMEARLVHGLRIDTKAYAALTSTLVRIAQCIGIDGGSQNATQSLHQYLEKKGTENGDVE